MDKFDAAELAAGLDPAKAIGLYREVISGGSLLALAYLARSLARSLTLMLAYQRASMPVSRSRQSTSSASCSSRTGTLHCVRVAAWVLFRSSSSSSSIEPDTDCVRAAKRRRSLRCWSRSAPSSRPSPRLRPRRSVRSTRALAHTRFVSCARQLCLISTLYGDLAVTSLIKFVSEASDTLQLQIDLTKESISWCKAEKRTFLRQRLQARLASLYVAPSPRLLRTLIGLTHAVSPATLRPASTKSPSPSFSRCCARSSASMTSHCWSRST